jgi:hypothetical protein
VQLLEPVLAQEQELAQEPVLVQELQQVVVVEESRPLSSRHKL